MSSLNDAFKILLKTHSRKATLSRGAVSIPVEISPTDYFSKLAIKSGIKLEGHEFIIPAYFLDNTGITGGVKRADRIVDPQLGTMTVVEVIVAWGTSATVLGYRVRTG